MNFKEFTKEKTDTETFNKAHDEWMAQRIAEFDADPTPEQENQLEDEFLKYWNEHYLEYFK